MPCCKNLDNPAKNLTWDTVAPEPVLFRLGEDAREEARFLINESGEEFLAARTAAAAQREKAKTPFYEAFP